MKSQTYLLSISIPAFNRPEQLVKLLESIDCSASQIEININEDCSPAKERTSALVAKFIARSQYKVNYKENDRNLGYDANLRSLVERANGEYLLFMGDDDLFVPGALDRYLAYLDSNQNVKYILRAYTVTHLDGLQEDFRYLPESKIFQPGLDAVAWMFKRSVTICGFTINSELARGAATSELDGTLLYQVYLMCEVCLFYESAYFDSPIVRAIQSFRLDKPHFGASDTEKDRYEPGKITPNNSINFTSAYFEVTKFVEKRHGIKLTEAVRTSISKYSYPFLSIQRKRGVREFLKFSNRLDNELGLGCTLYFYVYKYGLLFLGERNCDRLIVWLKRIIGHTPNL